MVKFAHAVSIGEKPTSTNPKEKVALLDASSKTVNNTTAKSGFEETVRPKENDQSTDKMLNEIENLAYNSRLDQG